MCLKLHIILVQILHVLAYKNLKQKSQNFLDFDAEDPSFKIKGGKLATTENWPYIAALTFYNGSQNNFCVGTLIRKKWLLTAAHCVPPNLVEIYGVMLRNNLYGSTGRSFTGELVTTHHHYVYTENNISNDIALVKLKRPVDLSVKGLAKLSEDPLVKDTACRTFGWGLDDDSKSYVNFYSLRAYVISLSDCTERMSDRIVNDAKVCTIWRKHKLGVCLGNTGGPLICDGEVYAVLSWSPECNDDYPVLWTRIEYYLDWINTVIRSENEYDTEKVHHKNYKLEKAESMVNDPKFLSQLLSDKRDILEKDPEMEQRESAVNDDFELNYGESNRIDKSYNMDYSVDTVLETSTTTTVATTEVAYQALKASNKNNKSGTWSRYERQSFLLMLLFLILCLINS